MTAFFLSAAALGGFLGLLGARTNRVRTSDERLLWVVAGVVGGPLALAEIAGVVSLKNLVTDWNLPEMPVAFAYVAFTGTLGAALTASLDESGKPGRWIASFVLKWTRSPIATTAGLLAALAVKILGRPVDFRRGMLFIDVAPGASALTLGAVGWCQTRCFDGRCLTDNLASHEAVHSRTVAAVGELGFYLTYLTAGVVWGLRQGGRWNDLTRDGCGQPFEKTAHTFTGDPPVANRCAERRRSRRSAA